MTKKYKVLDKVDLSELDDSKIVDIVNANRGLNWAKFLSSDLLLDYKKVLHNIPTDRYHVIMVDDDITHFEDAFKSAFGYEPVWEFDDYTDSQVRDAKALWDICRSNIS